MPKKTQIKVKLYNILHTAVEQGVQIGWTRSHKHTNTPTEESVKEYILREVMNELSDVVDFND